MPASLLRKRRRVRAALPLISLGLVTACASTGGLRPDATLLDSRRLTAAPQIPETGEGTVWPADDWWVSLGDGTLTDLIAESLRNNPDLTTVDARLSAANAEVARFAAERRPLIAGEAQTVVQHASEKITALQSSGIAGTAAITQTDLRFGWSPDLWGERRALWQSRVGAARAAKIDSRAARIGLSVAVARAYLELGVAARRETLANEDLTRTEKLLQLVLQRERSGLDGTQQRRQAEADVANARRSLLQSQSSVSSARIALAVLLGAGPARADGIHVVALLAPARVRVSSNLPAELIGHRPDIVAARWRVEAATHAIRAAKARFFPNVSIGGLAGFSAADGQALIGAGALVYQFGPAITLPLFDGGRLRAGLAAADADQDLAVAAYNKTLIAAVNEVADLVSAIRSVELQCAEQREAVDADEAAWRLSENRYRSGVGGTIEALIARRSLLSSQAAMLALDARRADLSLRLIQALGGGFAADTLSGAMSPSIPTEDRR